MRFNSTCPPSLGTIGIRAGVPADVDQWGWTCGFYPLIRVDGSPANFETARAEFEAAWKQYLPKWAEADFDITGASAHGRLGNM